MSIFIGVILISSSIPTFQNFTQKPLDQSNFIQKAFATSGDDITHIGNYTIFGISDVHLEKNVNVTSGNVGAQNSGSTIHIEKNSIIMPGTNTALVGDSISIEKSTTVNDVFYNQLSNQGTILGTKNTPLQLPVVSDLPTFPSFTPGSNSVTVNSGSSLTLQPGEYGSVSVGDGATLEFTGGIYNVTSIEVGKNSHLTFDGSSSVLIQNQLHCGIGDVVGPSSSSGIDASGIIFYVGSDAHVESSSLVNANIYTPNGDIHFEKNSTATGSFIGDTVHIEKDSKVSLLSAFSKQHILANEYLQLIAKLNSEGNSLNQVAITQGLVNQINSDLANLKSIVLQLQTLGFDGQATAARVGQHMVGTVSFSNKQTSALLFQTQIPDGTLGTFAIMGLNSEYSAGGINLSFNQLASLLNSSKNVVSTLTNFNDDKIASNFVLASIAEYHPSTGHTFIIVAIAIITVINWCLDNPECEAGLHQVIDEGTKFTLDYLYPHVTVSGLKFNDVNANGVQDNSNTEPGLPGWKFLMPQVGDPASPESSISDNNGQFSFVDKQVPRTDASNLIITEVSQPGWQVTTPQGLVQQLSFTPPSSPPFDQDVPVSTIFGNHETQSSQCITPPSGLVGWWPGDGNTNDLIGGHTGTISGGVTFAPGKVAQAFNDDGTGSVGVGSLGINNDNQPFSMVAWVNPTATLVSAGHSAPIIAEGSTPNNSGNGEFFAYYSVTGSSSGLGSIVVEIGATQTYSQEEITSPVIPPNQWSLVAVTYDGSRTAAGIKIYVNGVLQSTTGAGSGFTSTGSPRDDWNVGSQSGGFYPFMGLIDEPEIFNTAVTQQVIQSEFNADSAGKCKPGGTPTVIATIPLGAGVTNVAINPNTNTIYTSDDDAGTGVSSVINGNTNTVTATIPIGTFAIGLAVNPNTNTVYVQSSPNLLVINGNTNTVTSSLSGMGFARYGVAVNPNTNAVYVTSNSDNLLYVLNAATNTVVTSIPVGTDDSYDAVNPSTNTIYVTNYLDNTVSVINGNTNTVTATIPGFNVPYYIAANPNTNTVYVVNAGDNTVHVINGNTNTLTAIIPVGNNPVGVAINSATNTIYVTNSGSNTVSVINGNTNTVTATIPGFNGPFGIALNPATNNIYVANSGNNTISVLH